MRINEFYANEWYYVRFLIEQITSQITSTEPQMYLLCDRMWNDFDDTVTHMEVHLPNLTS